MNLDLAQARELVAGVRAGLPAGEAVDVAVCPTSIYLFPMAKALAGSRIRLGAQNMYFEPHGAFTGEVSAAMVKETGCTYVILGHSERRHTIGPKRPDGGIAGEDDAMIHRKVRAALASDLTPILCVGETLDERDGGRTNAVLQRQIEGGLRGLTEGEASRIVIAYEPVWAIGTGRNATPEQAQDAHAFLRGLVKARFGAATADALPILYGGSVKASNAAQLIAQPDVDGALVGGASLKADEFCGIIKACIQAKGLA